MSPSGIVVMSDVFGINSGRHLAIFDQLADELPGALVLMPDSLEGEPIMNVPDGLCNGIGVSTICHAMCRALCCPPCGCCRNYWHFMRLTWEETLHEVYMEVSVPYLKQHGAQNIASLGFCLGTYGSIHAGCSGDFSCGVNFHPAVDQICSKYGEDDIELVGSIKCPQMVLHTVGDGESWLPGSSAHNIADGAVQGNVWLRTDQPHGFMTRGDTSNADTAKAVQAHFSKMKTFLQEHLAM